MPSLFNAPLSSYICLYAIFIFVTPFIKIILTLEEKKINAMSKFYKNLSEVSIEVHALWCYNKFKRKVRCTIC